MGHKIELGMGATFDIPLTCTATTIDQTEFNASYEYGGFEYFNTHKTRIKEALKTFNIFLISFHYYL